MSVDTTDINELDRKIRILHRRRVSGLLKTIGLYDGQPRLLFHLSETGGCNQKELSEYLNVSCATIAVSLKRMEKCGVIEKRPDKNDLRNNIITLTSKGNDLVNKCRELFTEVKVKMYEGFNQDEIKNLKNYYERIIENLTDMND